MQPISYDIHKKAQISRKAMQYPEIATAAISGPEPVGDTMKYTFERAIGSKG